MQRYVDLDTPKRQLCFCQSDNYLVTLCTGFFKSLILKGNSDSNSCLKNEQKVSLKSDQLSPLLLVIVT